LFPTRTKVFSLTKVIFFFLFGTFDLFVAFEAGRFPAITTGQNCTAGRPVTSSAQLTTHILLSQVDGMTKGLSHFSTAKVKIGLPKSNTSTEVKIFEISADLLMKSNCSDVT